MLAIQLTRRGFAFCVFDGPGTLYDWGSKHIPRGQLDTTTLSVVERLIFRVKPDAVVIEDVAAPNARRTTRAKAIYQDIENLCDQHAIDVRVYPWEAVFKVFEASKPVSRHDIAKVIADTFPIIKRNLPPKRQAWLPPDPRLALFDSAALALTHYTANPV